MRRSSWVGTRERCVTAGEAPAERAGEAVGRAPPGQDDGGPGHDRPGDERETAHVRRRERREPDFGPVELEALGDGPDVRDQPAVPSATPRGRPDVPDVHSTAWHPGGATVRASRARARSASVSRALRGAGTRPARHAASSSTTPSVSASTTSGWRDPGERTDSRNCSALAETRASSSLHDRAPSTDTRATPSGSRPAAPASRTSSTLIPLRVRARAVLRKGPRREPSDRASG
jgi:hypothetical protein